jgi:hypothetical protein
MRCERDRFGVVESIDGCGKGRLRRMLLEICQDGPFYGYKRRATSRPVRKRMPPAAAGSSRFGLARSIRSSAILRSA